MIEWGFLLLIIGRRIINKEKISHKSGIRISESFLLRTTRPGEEFDLLQVFMAQPGQQRKISGRDSGPICLGLHRDPWDLDDSTAGLEPIEDPLERAVRRRLWRGPSGSHPTC